MARLRAGLQRLLDRHLFRIRRNEALPAILHHRRIFVLPTGPGIAYAVTLITMLVASMNYSLSLGFGLSFLLVGVGLASMHQAFRNLVHLELRAASVEPVHCGEPAQLRLRFENAASHERTALDLATRGARPVRFEIPRGAGVTVEVAIPTHHRGWLEFRRLTLETRYPLGLIRAWSVLTPGIRCLVYPRPETPPAPLPRPAADGQQTSTGRRGNDDFAGLRAYQSGDAPRHIAWKLAARGDGQLYTKLFTCGSAGHLDFDWASLPPALDLERRIERLTRWVIDAAALDIPFALELPGKRIEPGTGAEHRARCLTALALHGSPNGR